MGCSWAPGSMNCICWANMAAAAFCWIRLFLPLISSWVFRCGGGWRYLQFSRVQRPWGQRTNRHSRFLLARSHSGTAFNVVVMCKTSGKSERSCDQSSLVAEGQASLQHVSSLSFMAMIHEYASCIHTGLKVHCLTGQRDTRDPRDTVARALSWPSSNATNGPRPAWQSLRFWLEIDQRINSLFHSHKKGKSEECLPANCT